MSYLIRVRGLNVLGFCVINFERCFSSFYFLRGVALFLQTLDCVVERAKVSVAVVEPRNESKKEIFF